MGRSEWRGVAWPRVERGVCTKHGTRVGPFTGLCFACHRKQLEAAARGSREFERSAWLLELARSSGLLDAAAAGKLRRSCGRQGEQLPLVEVRA